MERGRSLGLTSVVSDDTSGDLRFLLLVFPMLHLGEQSTIALPGLRSKLPHSFSSSQLASMWCKSVYFRRYDFLRYAIDMVFCFISSGCWIVFCARAKEWRKRRGIFLNFLYCLNFGGKGVPLSILYGLYVGITLMSFGGWDSYIVARRRNWRSRLKKNGDETPTRKKVKRRTK